MQFLIDVIDFVLDSINGLFWGHILIYLLIGIGVFYTLRLGFVQVRHFGLAWKLLFKGKNNQRDHVSPFEALATSLAARIGTGNLAGVAVAISLGGPGAIFWMWVVAFLGMSTAFAEACLAQLFKVTDKDGKYRGGPAYYIQTGLGQRWLGIVFSICLIIAFGLVFIGVQSNTIARAIGDVSGVPFWMTAIILVGCSLPMLLGGMTRIAHFAGKIVPLMATAYVLVAIYIIVAEFDRVPAILMLIVKSAFGLEEAAGGLLGYGIAAAMANGIKRGLFSNEAGMGSAPNAAAAADPTPPHPAAQGFIQMLGVFIDTMLVCTATALIILLSGVFQPGEEMQGILLTQNALSAELGHWGGIFIAVIITLFSYTTILGNYAYADSCVRFISNKKKWILVYQVAALSMIVVGVFADMPTIWAAADASMALMATVNLIAIVLLSKYVYALIKDFMSQTALNKEPTFDPAIFPELATKIDDNAWQSSSTKMPIKEVDTNEQFS